MKPFTSLAVAAGSVGKREDGQTLVYESLALALLVFAFFGALWLLEHLA